MPLLRPFSKSPVNRRRISGLTLVELLVSCAVFAMLLVLLLQAFGTIASTTRHSRVRNELLRQAITTVERISHDLARVVRTGGLKLVITSTGINDSLAFVGEVDSANLPANPRRLSIVRFGVSPLPQDAPALGDWPSGPVFSRDVLPLDWADDLSGILPFSDATVSSLLNQTTGDVDRQQISPGVIRFEARFQLHDGSTTTVAPVSPSELRAIIIGIVVIEKNTFQRLSSSERDSLPAAFPKIVAPQRPLEIWQNALNQLPPSLQSGIQIYEHTLSL